MPVSMKNKSKMARRGVAARRTVARVAASAARQAFASSRRMGTVTRPFPAQLRGQAGPELKALDVPVASYLMNTTAVLTPLNLIRTGSTFCNRIGRKIEMQSIRVNGNLSVLRTLANTDYVRILIVYDRQTNGALPAIADLLQTTDQATNNTTSSYSGINLNNRDRFVILRDERIALPSITVTAGVQTNIGIVDPVHKLCNFDWFVKLKGLLTQYKADSSPAVIGDIASGGLYLVTFGGEPAGSEAFELTCEMRLRYLDA